MESTKKQLADWMEISKRADKKEELNPIDKFLLDNEPPLDHVTQKFRNQFLEAINYEDEESMTERNCNVVASFMEHCKRNGFKISDLMFETYFGA